MASSKGRYEVAPAHVLQTKYGLYAEHRPTVLISPGEVPVDLHAAIPLVKQWSIRDDIIRSDFVDKQSKEAQLEFFNGFQAFRQTVEAWIASLPPSPIEWPQAAIAFMYCLSSHDLVEINLASQEELEERQRRFEEEYRPIRIERACIAAAQHFRDKQYAKVVEVLTPFSQYLDGSAKAKLAFSLRKLEREA
jgi:hypothetical protein